MNTLDAVRDDIATLKDEIAQLEKRLGVLQTIEDLAEGLDGVGEGAGTSGADVPRRAAVRREPAPSRPPKPKAATPPRKPPAARSSSNGNGRVPHAERILSAIEQLGQSKGVGPIADATGITTNVVRQTLQKLVKDGAIVAEGATSGRVYMSKTYADQRERERPHSRGGGVDGSLPALKGRVLDLILTDPGALTEDRLALALNVDREDVALATGELLTEDRVVLLPDGTYTRSAGGGVCGAA